MSEDAAIGRKRKALELLEHRKGLPIWSARKKLVQCVQDHDTVILVGETGSGKTTQAPQLLYQQKVVDGCIACTQPRRVAAITVARRVAEECGAELGAAVGYSVRFDDTSSEATRVKYMTDGMLIREAILDPRMLKYSVVFLDEAHERTVNTDVLMGLLKAAQAKRRGGRNPLKLVIMSATLAYEDFAAYYPNSHTAFVQGRQFPVDIFYTEQPQDSYVQAAINAVLQIHIDEEPGAVLVFLTGQDEIQSVQRVLEQHAAGMEHPEGLKLQIVGIHASMPPEQQLLAFAPALEGCRKVILATNIAETSVTIEGVRYVVDTGLVKARAYSASRGLESLQVVPVSKAQARQRSGRAGREAPGKCFRLYPEGAFQELPDTTPPEILRVSLATVVLQLKAIGVHDVSSFDFMDAPPKATLLKALELLYALEALDSKGKLTSLGSKMARLPIDPQYAAVLMAASSRHCLWEAMAIVSMASSERVIHMPKDREQEAVARHRLFQSPHGDHLTFLNIFRQYSSTARKKRAEWCRLHFLNAKAIGNALRVFEQLEGHMKNLDLQVTSCGDDTIAIRQALVSGLFLSAARRQPGGGYKVIASGREIALHPSSCMLQKRPECVVVGEVILTSKPYAHMVTEIEAAWLPELVPRFFATAAPSTSAPGLLR